MTEMDHLARMLIRLLNKQSQIYTDSIRNVLLVDTERTSTDSPTPETGGVSHGTESSSVDVTSSHSESKWCPFCGAESSSGEVPAEHNGHRILFDNGSEVEHIWCSLIGSDCPICHENNQSSNG